ncbi:MAG: hypothetical protein AABZ55_03185 [Bdellovibrionota bacterium]
MSQDNDSRFKLDDEEGETPQQAPEHKTNGESLGYYTDDDENYASPEQFDKDKVRLVDFLQFPREKRRTADFIEDTYKKYENESVDRLINRVKHEHESELQGSTPFYKPGHIGALMYEYLNMIGVEAAFVSGLQHTKSSMTKTVQQRVDEINTLLRGVGGFNRQIKASFSRSAVIYLEQEDPKNSHREKVIFTVNLGDFELRYPLDESAEERTVEDGRTLRRLIWDEAVNTLAEIVSNTGMKPKYVKNDKNSCIFTMRQYLLHEEGTMPDEYFTFDLRHVNQQMKDKMSAEYTATIQKYDARIAECKKKLDSWFLGARKKADLKSELYELRGERNFYIGTHPDPTEMDTGLVFSIAVNTLKDYSITKDKMQVIMTKYILALSTIAVDKSMDQQVNTVYQFGQKKPKDFQALGREADEDYGQQTGTHGKRVVMMKDDLVRRKPGGPKFKV